PVVRRYQLYLRHGAGVFCMIDTAFLQPEEQALTGRFINEGFVTAPADDRAGLDRIQRRAAELAADYLKLPHSNDPLAFLDSVHSRVKVEDLNGLRMHVIGGLNAEAWLRPTYFRLARSTIETIVGNELCMQRRINLSVQMPADDSSLLAPIPASGPATPRSRWWSGCRWWMFSKPSRCTCCRLPSTARCRTGWRACAAPRNCTRR